IEASWTNIIKLATFESNPTASEAKRRFRRKKSTDGAAGAMNSAKYLEHQYGLHGNALVVSMLLHQAPHAASTLPTMTLNHILHLSEHMGFCQRNEHLTKVNDDSLKWLLT
ncbi:MAG: hypothetical protein ACREBR_03760, partial [bacterium]